jgi:protein-tyrosine-phosphatase/catechol 2,3-dioxygenase-like lactoylglutathione lyase family enzyme
MNRILFLCVRNSARSQMAEAYARQLLGPGIAVQSAGSRPTEVHALAAEVMAEDGIELSGHTAKAVDTIDPASVDTVVTLCAEEVCPVFPGTVRRLHWPIPDPAAGSLHETHATRLQRFRQAREAIKGRIQILAALRDLPSGIGGDEFHTSMRVHDLPRSVRFYAWLLRTEPKEWTHRYATFIRPDLGLNFVLTVADGKTLHHDTLYHLGVAVADKEAVIDAHRRALFFDAQVEQPPRTTWKGTPLHELWLADPDGNLIEIYARLDAAELAQKPADEAPVYLVAGTVPVGA